MRQAVVRPTETQRPDEFPHLGRSVDHRKLWSAISARSSIASTPGAVVITVWWAAPAADQHFAEDWKVGRGSHDYWKVRHGRFRRYDIGSLAKAQDVVS